MSILTLDKLKKIYEMYIDEENTKDHKSDSKNIWYNPSSAGSCIKKHLFKRLDVKRDPFDQTSKFTMRYGSIVHDDIQKALNKHFAQDEVGLLTEYKTNHKKLNLRGAADIVVIKDNTIEISDIKTIKAFKWKRLFGQIKNRDPNPNKMYEYQVGTYGLMVSKELSMSVSELSLLYWRKDDGFMKKVIIPLKYMALAEDYWLEVNEIVNESIKYPPDLLVPGEYINIPVEDKWECNWCSYASKCNSPFKKAK